MGKPDPRYWEVERWLRVFATSHAKRVNPRMEVFLETEGERIGNGYGLRLTLGSLYQPPVGTPPIELSFPEIQANRLTFAWCDRLAREVRRHASLLVEREATSKSA